MQLSKEDVFETQSIAHVRIHVERAISRVKSWHMFDQVITLSLYGSINQIWKLEYLFYANQFPKPKSNFLRWVFRSIYHVRKGDLMGNIHLLINICGNIYKLIIYHKEYIYK